MKEIVLVDVFPVKLLAETQKAYRFLYMGETLWWPKSLVTVKRRDQDGNVIAIQLPEWFYKKAGYGK